MKAVTRSEHKWKELIICILQPWGPRWYSQTYGLYAGWSQFGIPNNKEENSSEHGWAHLISARISVIYIIHYLLFI